MLQYLCYSKRNCLYLSHDFCIKRWQKKYYKIVKVHSKERKGLRWDIYYIKLRSHTNFCIGII